MPAAAQVDAAGDVEEPRELGETVAVRLRRDRGELVAQILRRGKRTLELQQAPLVREPVRAVRAEPAGGDDAVARHEEAEPVAGAEAAGGARGAGRAGERGELAVRHDLAARDSRSACAQRSRNGVSCSRSTRDVVRRRPRSPAKYALEPLDARCAELGLHRWLAQCDGCGSSCQTTHAVVEPELADAPAVDLVRDLRHAPRRLNPRIAAMSPTGSSVPPSRYNEPVRSYAPGTPRARGAARCGSQQLRVAAARHPARHRRRGGSHRRHVRGRRAARPRHVLATVHKGGAKEVERAIAAAAEALAGLVAHAVGGARGRHPARGRAARRPVARRRSTPRRCSASRRPRTRRRSTRRAS